MSKIVVVLGCHRSGTSMLAGMLSKMGVFMGFDLMMDTQPENPKGYYEDREFMKVSADIIEQSGADMSWDYPPSKWEIVSLLRMKPQFNEEIARLFNNRANKSIWGWKDPRTIIVFDAYKPILEERLVKRDHVYLLSIRRDPKVVLKSLCKRESGNKSKIELHKTIVLHENRLAAIESESYFPVLKLRYEDIVRKRIQNVLKIREFLGFSHWEGSILKPVKHIDPSLNRSVYL